MSIEEKTSYRPPGTHDSRRPLFNAIWPLLGVMLAGVWLGYPWALYNTWAVDGEGRAAQAKTLFVSLGFILALSFGVVWLVEEEWMSIRVFRYVWTAVIVLKLWGPHRVFMTQNREVELREYFGATLRNGAIILVAGIMARPHVLDAIDIIWLKIALA